MLASFALLLAGCVDQRTFEGWEIFACGDPDHCDTVVLTTDGVVTSLTLPGGDAYNVGRIEWPEGIPRGELVLDLRDGDASEWHVHVSAREGVDTFGGWCFPGRERFTGVVTGANVSVTPQGEGCHVVIDAFAPDSTAFVVRWEHLTDGPPAHFEARWTPRDAGS